MSADGGGAVGGPSDDPASRAELVGGPQLDATGFSAAAPGAGGGAVTLISCRAKSALSGLINLGGGGGAPSTVSVFGDYLAAGGGGAGGYLVIQGMTVDVTGQAYANGGGGGAGHIGGAGADGSVSAVVPAAGGQPTPNPNGMAGAGGPGGVGTGLPGNGLKAGNSFTTAGGGGGSTGYLQTYSSGIASISPSASSPLFGANGVLLTR